MRGAVTILHLILLVVVILSILIMAMPWTMKTLGESMDITEIKSIAPQFKACSEKIIETARTGTTNKCVFSVSRGEIKGRKEGIDYRIVSTAEVCDQQDLTLIDDRSHIYQACNVSAKERFYEMFWMFPSQLKVNGTDVEGMQLKGQTPIGNIIFEDPIQFKTLTLFVEFEYIPGESGKIVEISRINITEDKLYLRIEFL